MESDIEQIEFDQVLVLLDNRILAKGKGEHRRLKGEREIRESDESW